MTNQSKESKTNIFGNMLVKNYIQLHPTLLKQFHLIEFACLMKISNLFQINMMNLE